MASPSGQGGFKFSALKPLEGKTTQFCVIFDGSVAEIAANKELAGDADAGEALVLEKAKEAGVDPKDFLVGSALVYAFML